MEHPSLIVVLDRYLAYSTLLTSDRYWNMDLRGSGLHPLFNDQPCGRACASAVRDALPDTLSDALPEIIYDESPMLLHYLTSSGVPATPRQQTPATCAVMVTAALSLIYSFQQRKEATSLTRVQMA